MTLRSDQKALLFLGAVAVLGAGVRVVRASGRDDVGAQPALERQAQAADSAAKAGRAPVRQGQGRGQRGKRASGAKTETARSRSSRASRDTSHAREGASSARARSVSGPLDHPGYVAGKLDLDVATAAQIDSLPGISLAMAKRIVVDRMTRGPFVTRDGFRRVRGTGPVFMSRIDSLVTYSGTVRFPVASDTIIPPARRSKRSRPGSP
jgi:competence protein ComEA